MALRHGQEQRCYAVVTVGKSNLAKLFVSNRLAGIYGVETLPDTRVSLAYLTHLVTPKMVPNSADLGLFPAIPQAARPGIVSGRNETPGQAEGSGIFTKHG